MFSINKTTATTKKPSMQASLSSHRKPVTPTAFEMEASLRPTNQAGMHMGTSPVSLDLSPTLSGFLFNKEEKHLVDIYKDIYFYDVVAGTAVDLLSFLPFSDFSLRGLSTPEMERPFLESLERLNIHTLLPEISIDYLVFGTFIGSLIFNPEKKIFVDSIPQNFQHCSITTLPFYGVDPVINVDLPKSTVAALNSKNPRIQQIIKNYGEGLINKLLQGKLELDPLSTIYLPRRTMTCAEGTSYFRRILPIYFLEKNIFRGTLVESIKRQRAILHITVGDLDWEPSSEDLKYISELFINADNDPLGAIIATRNGVSTMDVRCIAGSTLVHTAQGVVPIQEVVRHDPQTLKAHTAIEVGTDTEYSLQVKTYNGQFVPVTTWWFQGIQPTVELVLADTTQLTATENHRWIGCKAQSFKLECLPVSDLVVGDYLVQLTEDPSMEAGIPAVLLHYALHPYQHGMTGHFTSVTGQQLQLPHWETVALTGLTAQAYALGEYAEFLETLTLISPTLTRQIAHILTHRYVLQPIVARYAGEMQAVYDLTIDSAFDPIYSANGVCSHNSGGDFWQIESLWNSTVPAKLKALNISEDFVNGAASVATMEASMSGFVEQLRSYRAMLTRKLFYNKLFPLISLTNELYVDAHAKTVAEDLKKKAGRNADLSTLLYQIQDTSSLVIPEVDWEKNLKPEGDQSYIDILKAMTEANIPVPIRAMAAAGGIKIDKLLKQSADDLEVRRKLHAYQAEIAKFAPPKEEGGEDSYSGFAAALAASYDQLPETVQQAFLQTLPSRSTVHNTIGKPNFTRGGEEFEITETTKTGKPKMVHNQRAANEKANATICSALNSLADKDQLL